MIARRTVAALALSTGLTIGLAGCARTPRPAETPPPANQDRAMALRQRWLSQDPRLQLGVVTAVLSDQRLASVDQVDVSKFSNGDVVIFIDSQGNKLVNGAVIRTTPDAIHVKYSDPGVGGRAPQKGDLAFREMR